MMGNGTVVWDGGRWEMGNGTVVWGDEMMDGERWAMVHQCEMVGDGGKWAMNGTGVWGDGMMGHAGRRGEMT